MVTGAIAYQALKTKDPAALAKIIDILEEHPNYEDWKDAMDHNSSVDRDMILFMLAARWPDDARGTPEDRPTDHYINLPYIPHPSPSLDEPDEIEGELVHAFRHNLRVLRDTHKPASQRAIAIAWLLHLTGDCHQPLHTAKLFTTDFPDGDRGGTRFYVKIGGQGAAVSLHQLWDGAVIGYEGFSQVRNKAASLQNEHPRSSFGSSLSGAFADPDFQHWIENESFPAAKEKAYRNGNLKGGNSKGHAKTLPANYTSTMKPVAEERITLAGYRIADILAAVNHDL
jgi:hypothetical protein